jgi:hypothetical protein
LEVSLREDLRFMYVQYSIAKCPTYPKMLVALSLLLCGSASPQESEARYREFLRTHRGSEIGFSAERVSVFNSNVAHIERFNAEEAPNVGYLLGVNRFADLTWSEFRELHTSPSVRR